MTYPIGGVGVGDAFFDKLKTYGFTCVPESPCTRLREGVAHHVRVRVRARPSTQTPNNPSTRILGWVHLDNNGGQNLAGVMAGGWVAEESDVRRVLGPRGDRLANGPSQGCDRRCGCSRFGSPRAIEHERAFNEGEVHLERSGIRGWKKREQLQRSLVVWGNVWG